MLKITGLILLAFVAIAFLLILIFLIAGFLFTGLKTIFTEPQTFFTTQPEQRNLFPDNFLQDNFPQKEKEVPINLFTEFKKDAEQAEGRIMHVYTDTEGFLTAGIGHKLTHEDKKLLKIEHYNDRIILREDSPIYVTDQQVDDWFNKDYQITLASAQKYFKEFDTFPELAQLAILNWIYQLGKSAPEKFPKATAAIIARDWKTAADNWIYASTRTKRHSKWFNQTQHRCEQESNRLYDIAKQEDK